MPVKVIRQPRDQWPADVESYVSHLESIKGEVNSKNSHVEYIDDVKYSFTYRQYSLMNLHLEGVEAGIALARSSYLFTKKLITLLETFRINPNLKMAKNTVKELLKEKFTPDMDGYMRAIKTSAARKLAINAEWLLKEAVELYEDCRKEKKHSYAIRTLELIGKHVDVDAFASNRVIVENDVDYAAILNRASERTLTIDSEPSKALEVLEHKPDGP